MTKSRRSKLLVGVWSSLPSGDLNFGLGYEFLIVPYTFSVIKPSPKFVNHPSTCTLSKTKFLQGFLGSHLMTPGGNQPSLDLTFLKTMPSISTNG